MTAPEREREWTAWRSKGIGASEVAGILGISPWQTPYSVWQSKVSGGSAGTSGNAESMRWGQLLENAILSEVERRLDLHVAGEQTWCTHRDHPWAIATVDAFFGETEQFAIADALGVVEVKTTSDPRWDDVPDHYAAQVQWQLEVTDLDHAWVACLHLGRRLSLWPVERDREIGQGLLEIAGDFWNRHVTGGEPPPLDGRAPTSAAIAKRYAASEPEMTVDLTGTEAEADIAALGDGRASMKNLEEICTELENKIKSALGPAEAGEVDGRRVVTWKATTSRRIDTTRLRDERPEIAAEYSTESTSRRFLLAKPKGQRR